MKTKEKYLDQPPRCDHPEFAYPAFRWPAQVLDYKVVYSPDDKAPEPVFIAQVDVEKFGVSLFIFGFKLLDKFVVCDLEENSWFPIYCVKEFNKQTQRWRSIFLQHYFFRDREMSGTSFYQQEGSVITDVEDYDEIKNKTALNLTDKRAYWGRTTKTWPKSPDGLLYLIAQIKEKRRNFADNAYPGGGLRGLCCLLARRGKSSIMHCITLISASPKTPIILGA